MEKEELNIEANEEVDGEDNGGKPVSAIVAEILDNNPRLQEDNVQININSLTRSVNTWLQGEGYITAPDQNFGMGKGRYPTQKGIDIGLSVKQGESSSGGKYPRLLYNADAQEFVRDLVLHNTKEILDIIDGRQNKSADHNDAAENKSADNNGVGASYDPKYSDTIRNLIISGPPGVGKSVLVREKIIPFLTKENDPEDGNYVSRIVFTPGTMYEDFFGCYKPVTEPVEGEPNKTEIKYRFVPGVFSDILAEALCDPDNNYVLVIEELNRAQVYDVFGTLFQLLDRYGANAQGGKRHRSESTVVIPADAKGSEWEKRLKDAGVDGMSLPHNLYIICTMNPADQGVNVLDTAFLRRFSMAYIDIENRLWCSINAPLDPAEFKVTDFQEMNEGDGRAKAFFGAASIACGRSNVTDKAEPIRKAINDFLADDEALKMPDDKLLSKYFIKDTSDDMEFIVGICNYLSSILRQPEELERVLCDRRLIKVLEAYKGSLDSCRYDVTAVFNEEFRKKIN